MDDFVDLLQDNESVAGRLVTSGAVLAGALVLSWVLGRILVSRADEPQGRYYARKAARYASALLALARFMVPVRTARDAKDRLARRIAHRLSGAGIEVASSTTDVRVRSHPEAGSGSR